MSTPRPDRTIDDLFAEFLAAQEARLSPKTYTKYEGIIDLYRAYLERYWPSHSGPDYDAVTRAGGTYCGTYGAEDITSGFSEFLLDDLETGSPRPARSSPAGRSKASGTATARSSPRRRAAPGTGPSPASSGRGGSTPRTTAGPQDRGEPRRQGGALPPGPHRAGREVPRGEGSGPVRSPGPGRGGAEPGHILGPGRGASPGDPTAGRPAPRAATHRLPARAPTTIHQTHRIELLGLFWAGVRGRTLGESRVGQVFSDFGQRPKDDLIRRAQERGLPEGDVASDGWKSGLDDQGPRALVAAR